MCDGALPRHRSQTRPELRPVRLQKNPQALLRLRYRNPFNKNGLGPPATRRHRRDPNVPIRPQHRPEIAGPCLNSATRIRSSETASGRPQPGVIVTTSMAPLRPQHHSEIPEPFLNSVTRIRSTKTASGRPQSGVNRPMRRSGIRQNSDRKISQKILNPFLNSVTGIRSSSLCIVPAVARSRTIGVTP